MSGKKKGTIRGRKERPRIIRALYRRDGPDCALCGGWIDPEAPPNSKGRLSIDHIVPRSEGGGNRLENLRLAHADCNNYRGGKATRPGLMA